MRLDYFEGVLVLFCCAWSCDGVGEACGAPLSGLVEPPVAPEPMAPVLLEEPLVAPGVEVDESDGEVEPAGAGVGALMAPGEVVEDEFAEEASVPDGVLVEELAAVVVLGSVSALWQAVRAIAAKTGTSKAEYLNFMMNPFSGNDGAAYPCPNGRTGIETLVVAAKAGAYTSHGKQCTRLVM